MLRCACVDDEALAREGLTQALAAHADLQLVGSYASADAALEAAPAIDVLFVDIEMPRKSGFELVAEWPEPLPALVFVTAYDQYAIEAFRAKALDYVLKPVESARFAEVAERLRQHVGRSRSADEAAQLRSTVEQLKSALLTPEPTLDFRTDEGQVRLGVSRVLYLEAIRDYVCVHARDRQYITQGPLKRFEETLQAQGFARAHKSLLVNCRQVEIIKPAGFGDQELTLSSGHSLRLSRRYRKAFLKAYEAR